MFSHRYNLAFGRADTPKRYGGDVTRTTLANWMIRLSLQLQPLINLMRDEQLNGFLIQADGYAGYEAVCCEQDITLLGCWDHARRKFKEAQDAEPKKKKNSAPSKADIVLQMIGKLYRIEREIPLCQSSCRGRDNSGPVGLTW